MGSRVYFVKTNRLPIIDVAIDVDAGSRWDPVGKEGLHPWFQICCLKGIETENLLSEKRK